MEKCDIDCVTFWPLKLGCTVRAPYECNNTGYACIVSYLYKDVPIWCWLCDLFNLWNQVMVKLAVNVIIPEDLHTSSQFYMDVSQMELGDDVIKFDVDICLTFLPLSQNFARGVLSLPTPSICPSCPSIQILSRPELWNYMTTVLYSGLINLTLHGTYAV